MSWGRFRSAGGVGMRTNLLKPYKFNKEFFEDIKGTDYDALKEDIKQNGIKVDLHITKNNTILCGHQRWEIAKEIGLKEVPIKVIDINDNQIEEYIIKDNLLRRHLTEEQKAPLYLRLLKQEKYNNRFGQKGFSIGNEGVGTNLDYPSISSGKTSELIAEELYGKENRHKFKTIERGIKFAKILEKSPELKGKKVSEVLNNYEIKEDKVIRKNTRVEIELDKLNSYDSNMFYFSKYYNVKGDKNTLCIDVTHGENDIRVYKEYYPTVLNVCQFVDRNGKELSLRDYANIQNFPKDYKFVGTSQEIKRQIGEAVSPKMGEYIIKKYITGKSYIELFAGCGGFTIGAHKLKKNCLWCNDFNKYSGHTFKLNFPKTEVFIGDIKEIDEKKIHKEVGDIDFIIGGPPCQGFSSAGQRLGFKEDSRNELYLEFLRFVKEFKPKQFIMENVKEIENYKDEIINDFKEIGYSIKVEKVNGLDIGMKQKRIRVFFIGRIKLKGGNENGKRIRNI